MFAYTRRRAEIGKELYSKTSTLSKDFYAACRDYFGVKFYHDTFIGVRSSQVRGLFLSAESKVLEANQPIAVIPLESLYTTNNIQYKPNAMRNVSLEDVRRAIRDEEFKVMAPQFYLGLQFSSIVSNIPDISRAQTAEEVDRISQIMSGGATPWARMLDDEDFNESFIFGMYGMALDTWQRQSYEEITAAFHRNITAIHERVEPPFSVDAFRRLTRLVLARAEHLPPPDFFSGSRLARRAARLRRRWTKEAAPAVVCMAPLLDLVNHSNRPNCGLRVGPCAEIGGKGAITIFSLARIAPGQEICRHYNFAISRPNALFRYGFLPFDLISIVEHDAIDEHLVKNRHMLREESEEVQIAKKKEMEEIKRLEKIFQSARSGQKQKGPLQNG